MNTLADFSTYRTGILQAKAYRNLRHFMHRTLKKHALSSTEWSILGVVSDETRNGGVRVGEVAAMLDVEPSFITNTVKKLSQQGYITFAKHEDDGRVKILLGTDRAHLTVVEIERYLRQEMRKWMSDIPPEQLIQYINVLEKISQKSQHKNVPDSLPDTLR